MLNRLYPPDPVLRGHVRGFWTSQQAYPHPNGRLEILPDREFKRFTRRSLNQFIASLAAHPGLIL